MSLAMINHTYTPIALEDRTYLMDSYELIRIFKRILPISSLSALAFVDKIEERIKWEWEETGRQIEKPAKNQDFTEFIADETHYRIRASDHWVETCSELSENSRIFRTLNSAGNMPMTPEQYNYFRDKTRCAFFRHALSFYKTAEETGKICDYLRTSLINK